MAPGSLVIEVSYVYTITHIVSGKRYIGKTLDPIRRWRSHKRDVIKNRQSKLSRALRAHGITEFSFQVIGTFEFESDSYAFEKSQIEDALARGEELYNTAPGGLGGFGGTASSKEGLRRYYANDAHRQMARERNLASTKRIEVRARVAKKLNEKQVIEIRKKFATGKFTHDQLGELYHVTGNTIWHIVTFKTWKNVPQ